MISPVLRKRPKNSKTLKTLHPLKIIQFIHFVQEGKLPPVLPSQPDAAACPAVAPLSARREKVDPEDKGVAKCDTPSGKQEW